MIKHFLVAGLTVILLMGCGGTDSQNTMTADQKVQLAATVAKEIQKNPSNATQTLKKHNLTQEQFENLLYEIAADTNLSQKYQAALKK